MKCIWRQRAWPQAQAELVAISSEIVVSAASESEALNLADVRSIGSRLTIRFRRRRAVGGSCPYRGVEAACHATVRLVG